MKEIADIVTNSFDTRLEYNSQGISQEEVEQCRSRYLIAIRNDSTLETFLLEQSLALQDMLTNIHVSPIDTTIAFYKDTRNHNQPQLIEKQVSLTSSFQTLGRYGQIRLPSYVAQVSRIHALLFHLTHTDGRSMFVILDFWSKGGTVVAGTTHASQPDDRRVLIVPDDEPIALHLGGLLDEPYQVILNVKKCLICHSAPRTELFETCMHLVACKDCLNTWMAQSQTPTCPICRGPVSLQCTRNADMGRGEYQTCNIDLSVENNQMETHMDQLHSLITNQKND